MIRRPWTPEDRAEVCRRYPHERTADIARDLGRSMGSIHGQADLLGLKKSPEYMREVHGRHIAKIGADARFKPSQAPWNKGVPGSTGNHLNTQRTQFKAGRAPQEAHNYRQIGSLRISADGCLERKVSDDTSLAPARRWIPVHRLIWIAAHGDVPPGHIVVFRPGMFTAELDEITLDRVELITRAELMQRNTRHRLPPEINSLIAVKGRLTRIINERSKASEKQN